MKTPHEVHEMRKVALAEQLKVRDRLASSPFGDPKDEVYALGVEAALLWVLGDAGSPLPR